ncbi:MAG: DUF4389 domain-containing protein [Thermoleophilaceae bacterium]
MAELVLVIVEGPGAGQEYALGGSVVAGRDPSAAIPLEDPEASRQHASITAREGGAVVEDLGSTNGTYVGDERLTGPREIAPGERFRIGTTVIELRGAAVVTGAPPPPPPATSEPAAPASAPEQPAPGVPAPAAGPPAPYEPPSDYPIAVEAGYPERIANWRPLVQWWLLLIPNAIAFFFVALVAFVAVFIAWFAVIITGRWPEGLFNFVAGTGRWGVRLAGYYFLLTERYPPFSLGEEPDYPIRSRFPYPEQGIARWRPIVQWILAIPHLIVLYVLQIVAFVCAIAAGFAILFTGKYPRGLYDIVLGYLRWQTRVNAYYYFLTDRYPPFTLSS